MKAIKEESTTEVIASHKRKGHFFQADGVRSFALEEGTGEAVVCLHGVPTSSFLYRKIVPLLADRGFRGISFDFPGLGLADRPRRFNYSFDGLARFSQKAIDALGLSQFHLVVHDIGGPIGFALATELQERVKSITILNTWIDVVNFEKPLPMRPFQFPVLGDIELRLINHITWRTAFKNFGVSSAEGISDGEISAYVDLLKGADGGQAFLKIMKGFDYSEGFRRRCFSAVVNPTYPIQAIWGAEDPGLRLARYGKEIRQLVPLVNFKTLAAKHLLQEEQPEAIVDTIAELAAFKRHNA